jgi:hypothetical protein
MEIKVKKTPVYKQVEDGFAETTVYVAKDGKEYKTEKEALEHEAVLISKKEFRRKYNYSFFNLDLSYEVIVIYELTEEVKRELKCKWRKIPGDEWSVGINLIHTDDSGDYEYQSVTTPEKEIEWRRNEIKQIEELVAEKNGNTKV